MIRAWWCSNDNFGDALTPWLIQHITGEKPIFSIPTPDEPGYLVTGSILGGNIGNSIVWGCGITWKDEIIYPKTFNPPTKNHKIMAVRGPLSRERVKASGGDPGVIGDPGLLLPMFYKPTINKKYKLGIIPSWVDYKQANESCGKDHLIINVFDKIEKVIDDICSCEMTISSALHGLIASVAYGIPTRWVEFSDKVIGDGSKFRDFILSLDETLYEPTNLREHINQTSLLDLPFEHNQFKYIDELYGACPFKEKISDPVH